MFHCAFSVAIVKSLLMVYIEALSCVSVLQLNAVPVFVQKDSILGFNISTACCCDSVVYARDTHVACFNRETRICTN